MEEDGREIMGSFYSPYNILLSAFSLIVMKVASEIILSITTTKEMFSAKLDFITIEMIKAITEANPIIPEMVPIVP